MFEIYHFMYNDKYCLSFIDCHNFEIPISSSKSNLSRGGSDRVRIAHRYISVCQTIFIARLKSCRVRQALSSLMCNCRPGHCKRSRYNSLLLTLRRIHALERSENVSQFNFPTVRRSVKLDSGRNFPFSHACAPHGKWCSVKCCSLVLDDVP